MGEVGCRDERALPVEPDLAKEAGSEDGVELAPQERFWASVQGVLRPRIRRGRRSGCKTLRPSSHLAVTAGRQRGQRCLLWNLHQTPICASSAMRRTPPHCLA